MQPPTFWQSSVSRESSRFYSRGLTKDGKAVFLRSDIYIPDGILQAFIRLNKYSQSEFSQICQHHAFVFSLLTLPPEVLSKILSYAKLYFHLLRLVCKFFSQLEPVVDTSRFMDKLLMYGHLEAAKFVREKYRVPVNSWRHHAAALGGSIETLEWLQSLECPGNDAVCTSSAMNGHLKAIKWAIRQKYDCDFPLVIEQAAARGHMHILLWIRKHYFLSASATKGAVIGEKIKVLKWLRKMKVPFHKTVCEWAVWRQNLEILKWLIKHGAFKDPIACLVAAKCPSSEILKCLIDNGFPYEYGALLHAAINARRPENIKWIQENLGK